MSEIIVDIEVFKRFFFIGMKRREDGKRVGVEFSWRKPNYDREFVRSILMKNTTVGFNSLGFDLPLIWYSLEEHVTTEHLKRASDHIIKAGIKYWDVEDFLGIRIPYEVKKRHIDLIEPQPNAFASLKILKGRMHSKQLQDLPFHPDEDLDDVKADKIIAYCMGPDLDGTDELMTALEEPLALRTALGEEYGQNFMSKSDSQIGEAIVKKRVEQLTGSKPQRVSVASGTVFRYPVPDFMQFETPELQKIVDQLRTTDFIVRADGKVHMPDWLSETTITIGSTTYQMGIGGLHSTEANRMVASTESHILVDADVASQYPAIILLLGLYPKALGRHFLEVYREIRSERIRAKKRAKAIKDELPTVNDPDRIAALKRELEQCNVKDKGLKISLNGVYGKLGSPYSVLYAPHLLISVTLTGQLSLLMLIERAEKAGIPVVSGNTDGVLFHCPRDLYDGLNKDRLKPSALEEVCSQWETDTGFDLEFGEYKAVYNQSVNSYFAIKPNGGHKRKGPLGNPWSKHKDDFDPVRGALMKNPQMTICSDAALARIKDGTPVAETVRNCRDIRQFITVIKASKGATWRGQYLGKTVRYYWSTDGEAIFESEPHPTTGNYKKIPKTDGATECMRLPDDFPEDIDYQRYIDETESILSDLGFYGPKAPPMKRIRITKANREAVLRTWLLAA